MTTPKNPNSSALFLIITIVVLITVFTNTNIIWSVLAVFILISGTYRRSRMTILPFLIPIGFFVFAVFTMFGDRPMGGNFILNYFFLYQMLFMALVFVIVAVVIQAVIKTNLNSQNKPNVNSNQSDVPTNKQSSWDRGDANLNNRIDSPTVFNPKTPASYEEYTVRCPHCGFNTDDRFNICAKCGKRVYEE